MTRAAALATAVLALAGLLVSVTASWPRLAEGSSTIPVVEPGLPAAPTSTTPRAGPAAERGADASVRPRAEDRSGAARIEVPTAGLDASVRPVGVDADGQMALPRDPAVLGWYRFGPAPGAGTGSVVLAGHLDSRRYGLGPLVGLREVEPGDVIRVRGEGGVRTRYTVVDVRRHDRQALPQELFSRSGPERLRVITCGGEYRPAEGGYQQNLVVTAVPD